MLQKPRGRLGSQVWEVGVGRGFCSDSGHSWVPACPCPPLSLPLRVREGVSPPGTVLLGLTAVVRAGCGGCRWDPAHEITASWGHRAVKAAVPRWHLECLQPESGGSCPCRRALCGTLGHTKLRVRGMSPQSALPAHPGEGQPHPGHSGRGDAWRWLQSPGGEVSV